MKFKRYMLFLLILITLTMVFFTGCNVVSGSKNNISNTTKNNNSTIPASDFTLKDLNDNEVSLLDFKGNVIVLNFWATWCPPCKAEIPDFVDVYSNYKDKGVSFLGISVDEDLAALKQFALDYNINYSIVIDTREQNIAGKWNVSAIPTTYFIDKNGNIADWNIGQISKSNLISKIDSLLNQK